MKRIYTKLIQSSLSFALVLGMSAAASAQCDIPPPEGSLWGTQFDGGLDGWQVLDGDFEERKNADGRDIGWTWEPEGNASNGSFATDQAIPSPSVCNGAMVFDSDFWDSQGTSQLGTGECIVPEGGFCEGILLSPTIDLSEVDATDFILQFASQHRHFLSEYSVLLSIDDGASWIDTIDVFTDGFVEKITNGGHLYDEAVRLPLCGLGNEREVRLAFWYQGNYYYWAIDDIHILPSEAPDLRVNENWFAVPTTYGVPDAQEHSLAFLADIENRSAIGSSPATLTVSIAQNGTEVYTQELNYPEIGGCVIDENRVFPEMYTPEANAGDIFTISYTVDADGDGFPDNNSVSSDFIFTDDEYIAIVSEAEIQRENPMFSYADNRFGAETRFQSFGNAFYAASGTNTAGEQLYFGEVNFGIETDGPNGDPLTPGLVEVAIYEWIDIDGNGVVNGDPMNEKIKLWAGTVLTQTITDRRNITIDVLDDEGMQIPIEDNTQYIVLLHFNPFNGTNYYNIVYSQSELRRQYYDQPMEFAYETLGNSVESNLTARAGTLGSVDGVTHADRDGLRSFIRVAWGTALVNLTVNTLIVNTEDINENIGIHVYPNPTSERVFADVALENTSESVNVEIVDMAGRVVLTQSFKNVKNERLTIDIQNLVDGVYVMNIKTDDGINTQKFTVANAK